MAKLRQGQNGRSEGEPCGLYVFSRRKQTKLIEEAATSV